MNGLGARIAALIRANGPISVSDYMALCLFDPEHGYYTTRQPFGRGGDFVTAPEISQMFGELCAAWLVAAWRDLGEPCDCLVAEIGPGRGTMMKDMLRTLAQVAPGLAGSVHLIEASPRLAAVQKETLESSGVAARWHRTFADLPEGPLLLVGNELFDAIPARQYVRTREGWRERCIALGKEDAFVFVAGSGGIDPRLLPPAASDAPEGAIFEASPAREALVQQIALRVAQGGGAALFFDYGHLEPGLGDTLQAVLDHRYDDPLAHPGLADLTSHVDFAALAAAVRGAGLVAHLATQGHFLLAMGLLERAGRLGGNASETVREELRQAVERLAGPDRMGNLFKVLAFSSAAKKPVGFS
ncbi:MAG: class I SAM-dependent methyltransferase [Rhizobiaceae bacterium]|nr:class I SAM-dependent methyltransferase [Rhizobiaceae bacterium]